MLTHDSSPGIRQRFGFATNRAPSSHNISWNVQHVHHQAQLALVNVSSGSRNHVLGSIVLQMVALSLAKSYALLELPIF